MKKTQPRIITIFSLALLFSLISGLVCAESGMVDNAMDSQEANASMLLSVDEYTRLTELASNEVTSDRVPFQVKPGQKVFLYIQQEDYTQPIGITVYIGDTNKMANSTLGATFVDEGIPGIFVSNDETSFEVQLSRSSNHAGQPVVVYGIACDDYQTYEKVPLPPQSE